MDAVLGSASVMIDVDFSAMKKGFETVISHVANATQSIREKFVAFGDYAGVAAGVIGTAFGTLAGIGLHTAAEMQKGQSQIQASLGLTAQQAKAASEAASNAFRHGFGESLQNVQEEIIALGKVFGDFRSRSQAEIQKLTEGVLTISEAFGQDAEEIGKAVKSLTLNFKGLSDIQALDVIAYGFRHGADSAGDLLDTLHEYAPQFQALGFSAQEMIAILVNGMKNGAFNADKLADAFKEIRLRLSNMDTATQQAVQSLGLNAQQIENEFNQGGETAKQALATVLQHLNNVKDVTQKNIIATQLMGTQYEDLGPKVITSLSQMTKGYTQVNGTTQQVADRIRNTFSSRFEQLKRTAQTTLGEIMTPFYQSFISVVPKVQPILQRVGKQFVQFAQSIKNMDFSSAFQKAFSPQMQATLIAFSGIIGGVLVGALAAFAVALWSAASPFILIGAGVALVIAGLVALYVYWDQITQWLQSVWNHIKQFAMSIWNSIANFFKQWGLTILAIIMGPIEWIVVFVITHWNEIKAMTLSVWNSIVNFFKTWGNTILTILTGPVGWITSLIKNHWNTIRSTTIAIWNAVKSWLSSTWSSIKGTASSVWNSVTSAIASAWTRLKSRAASIWNGIYSTIASWVNRALGILRPFVNRFNSVVSRVNSLTGSSLPTISMPGLAKGGIVTAPTMAMIGEGRYAEAVLPLSDSTFQALANGITSNMSGGKSTTINVYPTKANINERDLANILRRTEWMLGV